MVGLCVYAYAHVCTHMISYCRQWSRFRLHFIPWVPCPLNCIDSFMGVGISVGSGFGENCISLCYHVSIACGFLVSGETLCLLPSLSAGIPSALNPCRSYAHCHSLCGFMCALVLLGLEDSASCSHPSPLAPLPNCFLSPVGKGLDKDIPFRTESSRVSNSLHIVQSLVCVNSHPLQEKVSLMRAKLCNDLCL